MKVIEGVEFQVSGEVAVDGNREPQTRNFELSRLTHPKDLI
jgi:hypothetical protein